MSLFLCLSLALSCISHLEATAQAESHDKETVLKRVESKYVCMVTDQLFKTAQISVVVDGRTYYGCCPGCVSRLNQNSAIRHAVDPISQDTVDKATAVIGVGADGQVYYFESEVNMRAYAQRAHKTEDQRRERP